jgi:hypothetical protein
LTRAARPAPRDRRERGARGAKRPARPATSGRPPGGAPYARQRVIGLARRRERVGEAERVLCATAQPQRARRARSARGGALVRQWRTSRRSRRATHPRGVRRAFCAAPATGARERRGRGTRARRDVRRRRSAATSRAATERKEKGFREAEPGPPEARRCTAPLCGSPARGRAGAKGSARGKAAGPTRLVRGAAGRALSAGGCFRGFGSSCGRKLRVRMR